MDGQIALAKALVERNFLTQAQARSALTSLRGHDLSKTFEDVLLDMDLVKEESILEAKAALMNVPYIDLANYEVDPEVLDLVSVQIARDYKLFPLFKIDNTLLVAMADPKNIKAIDQLVRITQLEISPALSSRKAIEETIERCYGNSQASSAKVSSEEIQGILDVIEAEETPQEEEHSTQDLERLAEGAPVVKMTNVILTQAIMEGASDVHINPEETNLRVRYRVDGILKDSHNLPKNLQEAIISRIKILSNLDIAEKRVPQDGQLRIRLKDGRGIDFRVSTLPSAYGENVVMRILDKSAALLNLENLGFEESIFAATAKLLASAYGIFLVTGPTGSGKTTTLYASLNRLNSVEKNIITLEDPIEYRLPIIRQTQVNHKAGMTFAKGLRAILRQDPDIVMVGEIRDSETANIAVQAALTGHLVLSTLHTNDAPGAVTRLAEMGIEPFLVSSAVLGVMGQRLVRKICPDCKEEVKPEIDIPPDIYQMLKLDPNKPISFYKGRGCKACRDRGYRGRVSINEILIMNEPVRHCVLHSASADDLRKVAVEEGMVPLKYDGWIKVIKGVTTYEEVLRVTNVQ
jgi:type IV pilus assembly protein PilB